MTISQKIFEIIDARGISQKEFSEATGIPQSTISDWRKKNTNPASDKILIICETLDISPYELLSNVKEDGNRASRVKCRTIADGTEESVLLDMYDSLDEKSRGRLLGYIEALKNMNTNGEKLC